MANPTVRADVIDVELIFLVDVSGSMASYGKIQSLNAAMEEALPFLRRSAGALVELRPWARILTFGSSAQWITTPVALGDFRWPALGAVPGDMTELGLALDLVVRRLDEGMSNPPALILCTDGMPTDTAQPTFASALVRLDEHPIGRSATRAAITIGREADRDTVIAFLAAVDGEPLRADQPQQLAGQIRLAGESVLQSASEVIW
ncbi:MAG: hypothetical protein OEV40_19625 [Acidimicrobiia bacterium]|nr:hypothetical protein [Acidimicrobiia bacterium]